MGKKFGVLFFCIAFLTTALSGCQGGAGSGNGNIKIFYTVTESSEYYLDWVERVQEKAAKEGVQIDYAFAENSIEAQDEHIKKAVAEGYDAIICSIVKADIAADLKDIAGKIPMVFVNNNPPEDQLVKDKDVAVSSQDVMAGQFQAEYIVNNTAGKDELNVAILRGPNGRASVTERTKGVKQVLEESGKKINYVFEDHAEYNPIIAKEIYGYFLKTKTPVDCIICNNDSMALGAIEAAEEANVDLSSTMILGIDATEDGCKAILDGKMDFSVFQDVQGLVDTSVMAAIKLAKGESIMDMDGATEDGKYIFVPYEKVDSSNAAEHSGD